MPKFIYAYLLRQKNSDILGSLCTVYTFVDSVALKCEIAINSRRVNINISLDNDSKEKSFYFNMLTNYIKHLSSLTN